MILTSVHGCLNIWSYLGLYASCKYRARTFNCWTIYLNSIVVSSSVFIYRTNVLYASEQSA